MPFIDNIGFIPSFLGLQVRMEFSQALKYLLLEILTKWSSIRRKLGRSIALRDKSKLKDEIT